MLEIELGTEKPMRRKGRNDGRGCWEGREKQRGKEGEGREVRTRLRYRENRGAPTANTAPIQPKIHFNLHTFLRELKLLKKKAHATACVAAGKLLSAHKILACTPCRFFFFL